MRRSTIPVTAVVVPLLLPLVLTLTGCGPAPSTGTLTPQIPRPASPPGQGTAGKGYDTPQAVFDAAYAAQKKDDFKTFVGCLSPDAQKQLAGSLAAGALNQQQAAQGDAKFKEQYKLILAALDKHGLTYDLTKGIKTDLSPEGRAKTIAEVTPLIKDPAGFVADLHDAYSKTEPFNHRPQDMPAPKLSDVKIDGDKATGVASVTINGAEMKNPVTFVKIGGAWTLGPEPQP